MATMRSFQVVSEIIQFESILFEMCTKKNRSQMYIVMISSTYRLNIRKETQASEYFPNMFFWRKMKLWPYLHKKHKDQLHCKHQRASPTVDVTVVGCINGRFICPPAVSRGEQQTATGVDQQDTGHSECQQSPHSKTHNEQHLHLQGLNMSHLALHLYALE